MYFLMAGRSNGSASTSATNYLPIACSTTGYTATEVNVSAPVSAAFEMSSLQVEAFFPPGSGKNYVYTVRKNGVDTGLTCTMADANTVASNESTIVSFAAGDTITLSVTPTGTPTAPGFLYFRALCNTTASNAQVICGVYTGTSIFNSFVTPAGGGTALISSTEADTQMVIPCAGTISNLRVAVSVAPGSTKSWGITMRKNGSSQSVTTTIANAATTGSDTSNSFSVSAGDLLNLQTVATNTPAATRMSWSFVFTPTTDGDSMYGISSSAAEQPVNSAARYNIINGKNFTWDATEANMQTIVGPCKLKALYVKCATAPSSGKSYTYTIRKNGANTALSATISDANTTANVTSPVQFDVNDKINFASTPTGTPTAPGALGISYAVNYTKPQLMQFF